VLQKYIYLPLNYTWMITVTRTKSTWSQHGTLRVQLRICWNWISQPVLNVILTKSTTQITKPECSLQEQFQNSGRAEQGRGRGVNRFPQRRSIILFSQILCQGYETKHGTAYWQLIWGVKCPRHATNHSPQHVKAKNAKNALYPHVLTKWCLIRSGTIFTFYWYLLWN
jgi:hypothetical protein